MGIFTKLTLSGARTHDPSQYFILSASTFLCHVSCLVQLMGCSIFEGRQPFARVLQSLTATPPSLLLHFWCRSPPISDVCVRWDGGRERGTNVRRRKGPSPLGRRERNGRVQCPSPLLSALFSHFWRHSGFQTYNALPQISNKFYVKLCCKFLSQVWSSALPGVRHFVSWLLRHVVLTTAEGWHNFVSSSITWAVRYHISFYILEHWREH